MSPPAERRFDGPRFTADMTHEDFVRLSADIVRYVLVDEKLMGALAAQMAPHLPPHPCRLDPDQAAFLKSGTTIWKKTTSVVGTAVLLAAVGLLMSVIGLGIKAWLKLKGV